MTVSTKSDWLIPAGLVALSIIPIAAGTSRLVQLGVGAEITPESTRFFAAPLPFVLHIFSAVFNSHERFEPESINPYAIKN